MGRDGFNSGELEKTTALLLDAVSDILAAIGAPLTDINKLLLHSSWEDLRRLLESSKPSDQAAFKRLTFNLAGKLAEVGDRLTGNPAGNKAASGLSPEGLVPLGFLIKVLSPIFASLGALRPGSHIEEVKALEAQLRANQDLSEFFQDLNDFILQAQEDIWTEKVRAMERIRATMKKLEETERSFLNSMAASQDHLEKTERGFSQAMVHGLEEIDALTKPRMADLDDLCLRLSEKVNRLYDQIEFKKKTDQARLEVLDQDRRTTAMNLENTRRDYEVFSNQSREMLREIESLRAVSFRDPLTGVYNRRAYDRQITATMAAVETGELKIAALAVFDIDNFREFNNQYGHLAGDLVLTHVVRVTAETLRGDDFLFRYGGDEFVIILPNNTRQTAFVVGEKVRQSIGRVEFKIFKNRDQLVRVTVSVGVAEMEKGDDPGRFFARADKALYRAKKGGRNLVLAEPDEPAAKS